MVVIARSEATKQSRAKERFLARPWIATASLAMTELVMPI
jgi:hypothetical protein